MNRLQRSGCSGTYSGPWLCTPTGASNAQPHSWLCTCTCAGTCAGLPSSYLQAASSYLQAVRPLFSGGAVSVQAPQPIWHKRHAATPATQCTLATAVHQHGPVPELQPPSMSTQERRDSSEEGGAGLASSGGEGSHRSHSSGRAPRQPSLMARSATSSKGGSSSRRGSGGSLALKEPRAWKKLVSVLKRAGSPTPAESPRSPR